MNIEDFRNYCVTKKGMTEEFPFDEQTLVFKVMGKMFALVPLERVPSQANLKCDPERAIALREEYDGVITAGYHMSKVHWNTIKLDGSIPQGEIERMMDNSFHLVVSNMVKQDQQSILLHL